MGRKKGEPTQLVRLKVSDIKRLKEMAKKNEVSIGVQVRRLMRKK